MQIIGDICKRTKGGSIEMKHGLNIFMESFLVKFKCEDSDNWRKAKETDTDGDASIPVIHPDAVNATAVTFFCAAAFALLLIVYLFCGN